MKPPMPVGERFWKKVQINGPDECWLYLGALNADHYGVFRVDHNGTGLVYAHRLSYVLTYGPIPDGLEILHKCPLHIRSCVNPAHLKAGTHGENISDANRARKRGKRWGEPKRLEVAA